MLLKNHLDVIGRNEPIQRKARFWQSYVRALKGTDDMRAPEQTHYSRGPSRGLLRPFLHADFPTWPSIKSIYDDPIHPGDRIAVPGYRYLPISREIYGISPRNIYPHHYSSADRYPPHDRCVGKKLFPLDEDEEFFEKPARASSLPPTPYCRGSKNTFFEDPLRALKGEQDFDARMAAIEALFPLKYRHPWMYKPKTPAPRTALKPREYTPPPKSPSESIGQYFNYAGQPIYTRGGYTKRPLIQMLEPSPLMPKSLITRDPWWHEFPELRPYNPLTSWTNSPFYLRDSYLSPVKRTFLWADHPIRPFAANPGWWL